MNLPLGTRVKDRCPNCKENVTGIVTKKGVATFTCTACKKEWEIALIDSKGKGSKFSNDSLKELLERNKHVRIK